DVWAGLRDSLGSAQSSIVKELVSRIEMAITTRKLPWSLVVYPQYGYLAFQRQVGRRVRNMISVSFFRTRDYVGLVLRSEQPPSQLGLIGLRGEVYREHPWENNLWVLEIRSLSDVPDIRRLIDFVSAGY